jgi:uncharacterized protein
MKWRRSSGGLTRVEDRRGQGGSGGGFPIPVGRKGAGLGGVGIIGIVLALVFGVVLRGGGAGFDIRDVPQLDSVQAPAPGQSAELPAGDEQAQFVKFVADDAQALWQGEFQEAGRTYEPAGLVLFTSGTVSGCGPASAATGPFYCPADQRIYIDLSFYNELRDRFGAPGDFAQAYVIAHEVGHHIQTQLGINSQVNQLSQQNPEDANPLSVRLELQADCLAGVWAHSVYARGDLDSGDIEEGLGAAAAVGDDRIQQAATGRIDPESWTHGSAEQRTRWFQTGYESGDSNRCGTFSAENP